MADIKHIKLLNIGEALTIEKLNSMEEHTLFSMGKSKFPDEEIEMRWLAKRGKINDWAIYYGPSTQSIQSIADYGSKLDNHEKIKNLVPCETEAFRQYRF